MVMILLVEPIFQMSNTLKLLKKEPKKGKKVREIYKYPWNACTALNGILHLRGDPSVTGGIGKRLKSPIKIYFCHKFTKAGAVSLKISVSISGDLYFIFRFPPLLGTLPQPSFSPRVLA